MTLHQAGQRAQLTTNELFQPLHESSGAGLFHHHHHHNNNNNSHIQRRNLRFFTISSLRPEPSLTRMLKWPGCNHVQITCNTLSAYHMQHVVLCATWYEGTAQLLSLTELKSHLFKL